ncbi:hypothetical protein R5R73_02705 [Salinicola sp. LHM]|uniref:hypothetical protein n=1 Tax=Salinicola sp. LHM TaxID=3065298 RepID=UPI002ACE3AE4|nr:hypothetical protein [Salinicola sp. LHM]WQH33606.1 hypothetical protein R5R73_02705 [Salinicola sp. LHM]
MSHFDTQPDGTFHSLTSPGTGPFLFAANAKVPRVDALREAAVMLSTLQPTLKKAIAEVESIRSDNAYLMHHALESAIAIIDTVASNLERGGWDMDIGGEPS